MDSRLEPAPSPPRYVGLPPGLGVTQLCNFATCNSWVVSRSRARSAARPCTTSCGFETSEPIPFPGADSIFSSRCGAISGRLRLPSGPLAPRSGRPKRLGSKDGDRLSDPRRDGGHRNKHRTVTQLWQGNLLSSSRRNFAKSASLSRASHLQLYL